MPELDLPSVVFYGTPEFAVASLKILFESHFKILAVITAPDKPSGRGLQLQASPVKQFAIRYGIPVLQPVSLKDPQFLEVLQQLHPMLQVVVAFRKLPEEVWRLPVLGTFNLHASLLPDYRGAAPINWALINGDSETGLTTFLINEDIDTGNLLLSERVEINETDTAGDLHDRLMEKGAGLVVKSALQLASHKIMAVKQADTLPDGRAPRPAPKIFRETCRIDWQKTAVEVYNKIRGLSPYPGAYSELSDDQGRKIQVKIFFGEMIQIDKIAQPGKIITDNKSLWLVGCRDAWLQLKKVQLPGKKALNVKDLLNGFQLGPEWKFLG